MKKVWLSIKKFLSSTALKNLAIILGIIISFYTIGSYISLKSNLQFHLQLLSTPHSRESGGLCILGGYIVNKSMAKNSVTEIYYVDRNDQSKISSLILLEDFDTKEIMHLPMVIEGREGRRIKMTLNWNKNYASCSLDSLVFRDINDNFFNLDGTLVNKRNLIRSEGYGQTSFWHNKPPLYRFLLNNLIFYKEKFFFKFGL